MKDEKGSFTAKTQRTRRLGRGTNLLCETLRALRFCGEANIEPELPDLHALPFRKGDNFTCDHQASLNYRCGFGVGLTCEPRLFATYAD
jgi:hypothetical protein